jgi:hypothetical protein
MNYQWKSSGEYTLRRNELVLSAEDGFCRSCTFYIAVYGSPGARYTLRALTSVHGSILLSANRPTADAGVWKTFYAYIDSLGVNEILGVEVTVFTGRVEAYLGTSSSVPITDSTRYATKTANQGLILSTRKQAFGIVDTMYVLVKAVDDAVFSVVLSTRNVAVMVSLGIEATKTSPKPGSLHQKTNIVQRKQVISHLVLSTVWDQPQSVRM